MSEINGRLKSLVAEMVERGVAFEHAEAEFEKIFILAVLARTRGNLSKAASELGMHRNTLAKRVEGYHVTPRISAARRRHREGERCTA